MRVGRPKIHYQIIMNFPLSRARGGYGENRCLQTTVSPSPRACGAITLQAGGEIAGVAIGWP